jgi:hypothetical protein
MEAKHTPGPWLVDDQVEHDRVGFIAVATEAGAHVCDIFPFGNRAGASDRSLAVHRANANLLAAAPDMLEALNGFVAAWDHGEDATFDRLYEAAEIARAAIAKADPTP